ncbi:heparinase II/III family protein [Candidatus Poribacteria bacterium]
MIFICAILVLTTTLIPALSLAETEEEQRLKEEIAASAINRVDFSEVGSEVDVIRFGTVYEAESRAHDIQGRFGVMQDRKMTLGRNHFVEWTFTAPQAGDYVLTIAADIARLPNRSGRISVQVQGEWKDYGQIAESGQYHCTATLPQGETRFRLANAGGHLFYTSGARLSTVRGDPWSNVEPGEHPRLQFDREEIAKIQQRIASDSDHPVRYYYDGLLAAAENQTAKPSRLNGPRASAQALHEVAIAYALTGKKEYSDRGIDYLERLSQRDFGRNPSSVLGNGEYLDCMAWGYDVLYDRLTEAQRQTVRQRLDLEAHWLWVQARTLSKDTVHGWWSSDHANNWQAVAAGGLGMAALSLLGESSNAEMWLGEAIAQMKMLLNHGFDSDGAYFESPMYHKYTMNYMTPFATALLRAGRGNLFEYRDGVLQKTCLYNLYMIEPTRDHFAPFNDGRRLAGNPPQGLHPADAYFARLASVYQDGLLRWLFDKMFGLERRFPVWNFQHGHPDAVVWYDDTVPVENPDTSPRLALARYWPEHGRVALRTGWNDPDGILFAMECGEYGSHGHADQGSFVLTAYGEHLVDDIGYGGWEATSEAHSVTLIDGEGQRKGGMLGSINDFVHTEAMDYFEADSTQAYNTEDSPTQLVKRHVLFMRPGYFVIVDELRKDDQPQQYEWLLHSRVHPVKTDIQIRKSGEIRFQNEGAALDIRMLATDVPQPEVVDKQEHRFLRVGLSQKTVEATFFALLYPTSTEHSLPSVTTIRTDDLMGMEIGSDIVLWSQNGASWEHAGMKTDARFAAYREEPASAFVKSARLLEWTRFGFEANGPITAILTEKEARLVLSAPTVITFTGDYMGKAFVYQTDQDRDPSNDLMIQEIGADGSIDLPAGAYTIRR